MGGTLYQDIELQHEHKRVHRSWDVYDQHAHEIAVEPDSWLARWCGGDKLSVRVNSVHHQGIKQLGRDLVVEARAVPDGVVEAVRYHPSRDSGPWMYGVQWHPEFMQHQLPPDMLDPKILLHAFLQAVDARRVA
jgi:putative glutamine amidotransferase